MAYFVPETTTTARDATGKRVNASEWCGGYSSQFANNILGAFEKQLKAEIKDCFAVAKLDSDTVRRQLLNDVPMSSPELGQS